MTRETIEQYGGDFGFLLVWSIEDHWANVTAYRVAGHVEGEGNLYAKKEWKTLPDDMTHDYTKAEEYLSGFVKWDGCTELNQGQPHWCGPHDYKLHIDLLKHIFYRSHELMGRPPEDDWPD